MVQVACRGNNKMLRGNHQKEPSTSTRTEGKESDPVDKLAKLLCKYAPGRAEVPLLDAGAATSQPVVPTPARATIAPPTAATLDHAPEPLPLADVPKEKSKPLQE